MPIIIAVHIAKRSAMCVPSHRGVIIHRDGPVMRPYMSAPIAPIQIQHATTTIRTPLKTKSRSRSSAASVAATTRDGPGARLSDDAVGAPVDTGEMRMRLGEIERQLTTDLRRAARELGLGEFEASWQCDADAMTRAGHGVHDRLHGTVD